MAWQLESWATMASDKDQAVKITVKLDHEPTGDDFAKFRGKASALFMNTYGHWADTLGERVP